ncbi:MAG TPA: efflux RND transporter permease subunit, partial [Oligoflexia bacterium]|nr:efflux RND transporter permease subunit [Oligoflexia bacterium]
VSVSGAMTDLELRKVAKHLENEIEAIPGVARVVHRGLRDLEIRVEADQNKLARYRLSLDDLIRSLKGQNVSIPGGTVEADPEHPERDERIVRTIGDFLTLEDVRKTVIRANDLAQGVRVGDVAKVYDDLERATTINGTDGLPAFGLTVLKKEKADAITLVDSLKTKLNQIGKNLDPRVKLSFLNDMSEFIRRRLNILTGNLMIGLVLVLFLLSLILPIRVALIVSLGIPFAFLGTMLIFQWMGFSINLISMLGLIIVSGMLVDDAIVVTDNSVRLIEEGMEPRAAAIEGASQMVAPVTASVLTTIVAFLPMMFMSGIFGKFVREIPLGVICALLISLFEGFFILPGHIARFVRVPSVAANGGERKSRSRVRQKLDSTLLKTRGFWESWVVPRYIKLLTVTLRHRWVMMLALVFVFSSSIGLAVKGMRFILFPPEGIEIFFIRAQAKVGSSLETTARLTKQLEKIVEQLPKNEVKNYITSIGIQQQDPNDPNTKRGSEYAQITVFLTPETERKRKAIEIIEAARQIGGTPKDFVRVSFERVSPGPPTGKPVSIGVRGKTYEDIMPAVKELKQLLTGVTGVTDINDSYVLGKPELRVAVNPTEAAAAGLTVAGIGTTVRAAFEGIVATSVRNLDEEIDVRVSLLEKQRSEENVLREILVPNSFGNLVPLASVARISEAQSLAVYEHEANQRQVKVTAEVDVTKSSALEANNAVRAMLPDLNQKFPNVTIAFGGEDEDTQESLKSLMRAFGIAFFAIFLILVMTFKQLLQPLLVLITLPLGIISVIWTLFFHGLPLSFMSMLGIIALGGVIVNNAIVFVDFVNQRRINGMDRFESIIQTAKLRIRPIFLTTTTTVAGLLPTAYGIGGLDRFVVPIALALGWGLAFGSLLTAFVFPSAIAVLDDISEFLRRKFPGLYRSYDR